jgi:superfamily II DNA/RNA helicase
MVFVNTKDEAEELKKFLGKLNFKAEILTGKIDQKERDRIIDNYRKLNFYILICTNVLARGIDVPEVDVVVNFDVPYISNVGWKVPDFANYMHRVGRTGRFGTDGIAVSFVVEEEETENDILDEIEKFYGIEIK